MENTAENIKENLNGSSKGEAKASMNEAVRHMKDAATNVKDAARSLHGGAKEDLSQYMDQGQEKLADLTEKAETYAREKPLYVVGGAFVAGWLVSRMFSRS